MLENECEGGELIIVDGWEIVEDLRKDHPEYFNILKEFNVPFRQFDENNETYAEAPIIKCSSDGSVESFRFSNQLMQMIDPHREDVKSFYKAYHEVSARVHDSKYRSTFRLHGGEVLIVASLRVLHARESFIPDGKRHLQDAYFVYDNALNNCVI
jgi:gamma-butyrobetaine dioxygenase